MRCARSVGVARVVCGLLPWLAACGPRENPTASLHRAEAELLGREVAGLSQLVAAAERGQLLRDDQIVIGIDEAIVRELLLVTLPYESVVRDRYRVRIETASASFRASQATVTLRGAISPLQRNDTYAVIDIQGGVESLTIDSASGRLRGRVVVHHFEIHRAAAGGTDSALLRDLLEDLGRQHLAALNAAVPPLEVPVRLEEAVELAAIAEGPILVPGGRLPLRFDVVRLLPLDGKLWIVLDAQAGPWERAVRPTR